MVKEQENKDLKLEDLQSFTLVKVEHSTNGFYHKNEDNFNLKNDKPCYIGEYGFENATSILINGEQFFVLETVDKNYIESWQSIFNDTKQFLDSENDRLELTNAVFEMVDWQNTNALMDELMEVWDNE